MKSDEVCKVEWWTPIPGIEKIEPIRPGLNFIPEWVKNIPKSSNELVDGPSPQPHKTIRDCPEVDLPNSQRLFFLVARP